MHLESPDYQPILEILKHSKNVLVTTHVRPDGDALGSSAAMVMGMRQMGISSEVLLLSHLPRKYAFVFQDNHIPFTDVEAGWPATLGLGRFDCLLVVDTGTWSQLPGLRQRIDGWDVPKLVIDHHLTQENWATQKLVITAAAAAGEIVAELLRKWHVAIDSPIANALFLAIASDTGWFQFSNTHPFTLRLAASFMEAGIDTDRLYQHLYQNERAERFALQTRAQQSLELLADNRLAIMCLRQQDFHDTKAGVADTESLINLPLQIASVELSVLITEPIDFGPVRASFRSKGKLDVARFAEQFGGGGHARAAGCTFQADLSTARQRIVEALTHANNLTQVQPPV